MGNNSGNPFDKHQRKNFESKRNDLLRIRQLSNFVCVLFLVITSRRFFYLRAVLSKMTAFGSFQ